jgi:hypothetical protein
VVTMAERLDAIYPRVSTALAWGTERYGIADYYADTEETRGAEALFNARLNDYAQGGSEAGVKVALKTLIEAHAKRGVR